MLPLVIGLGDDGSHSTRLFVILHAGMGDEIVVVVLARVADHRL